MSAPREATLYREKGTPSNDGVIVLTRGNTCKPADITIQNSTIDILAGKFWIQNLPDWFILHTNEAYLEITVTTNYMLNNKLTQFAYPFKFNMDVADNSFCADIAGADLLRGIVVKDTGIDFRIALSEVDKINKNKFQLIQSYIQENNISALADALIKPVALPVNSAEVISLFFNTVKLLDALNEDDVIWKERPKLDVRQNFNNPLYEGWYAFVMTPKSGVKGLPAELYLSNGALYKKYTSADDNEPFIEQTYFSWSIIKQQI